MTSGDPADAFRLEGGPYDGDELDRGLFGGRMPNGLGMPADGRVADYDLDIDADGPYYRFAGWQPRTPAEADWELLRLRTERAREAARSLIAESRCRVRSLRRTKARTAALCIDLGMAERGR